MARFLREPLFHFLLLGALMFAAYTALQDNKNYHPPTSIAVTPGRIQQMTATFANANGRQPSADELHGVIDAYVHDEILVREAMKLGLDQDDPVIRATLIEKVRGLADFGSGAAEPTDAELQAYLDSHREDFMVGDVVPGLAEAHDKVKAAWDDARKAVAEEEYFKSLQAGYKIEIVLPAVKS